MNYQQMGKYSGSLYGQPSYEGLEYDWEVPDNLVVGSPGGVSTIHHHYTKGFNGRGNTSSDVYAGQGPRYISGVYGNLYQTGQEAGQHMGYYPAAPDYKFWRNQEPQQHSEVYSEASMWDPSMKEYGEPGSYMTDPNVKKKDLVEGYTAVSGNSAAGGGGEDFTMVEQSDIEPESSKSDAVLLSSNISPWILFFVLLLMFIVFFFWSTSGMVFIKQYLHKGRTPPWQRLVLYSIGLTIIFGIVFYFSGIPSATVEVES